MSNSTCLIAANGDVAGIGVRVAFYIQALLPLLAIAVVPHASIVNVDSARVEEYCTHGNGSLVVFSTSSAALLVTAFIERIRRDLSPYHALVVLNLTWIILLSSCCRAAVMYYLQKHGVTDSFVQRLEKAVANEGADLRNLLLLFRDEDCALFRKLSWHVSVLLLHLIATGVLGWMLFSDLEDFAGPAGCPQDTVLWMFSSLVHVTGTAPRQFWKSVYMIALLTPLSVPILSFLFCALLNVASGSIRALCGRVFRPSNAATAPPSFVSSLRAFEALSVALLALLVVSTEKTIAHNPVAHGEDAWGFGQVLALVLGACALYESAGDLHRTYQLRIASLARGNCAQNWCLPFYWGSAGRSSGALGQPVGQKSP